MLEPPPRYFLTCCCCCNPQQCPTQHDIRAITSGGEILLPAGAKAPRLHTFARNSRNKLPQHEATHAGMGTWGSVLRSPKPRYWHHGRGARPTHYNYGGKVAMTSHYPSAQRRRDYFSRKCSCGLAATADIAAEASHWLVPMQAYYGDTAAVKSRYLSAQRRRDVTLAFTGCNHNTYPDVGVDVLEPPPRYGLTCCCCCNPQQCPTQHDNIRAISSGGDILLPAGAKAPRLHTFARNSRNKLPQHEATHAGMGTWGLVLRIPERTPHC